MFARLVSLALILVPSLVFAQTPAADAQHQQELAKKPQWQRLLKGDDAKTAEKLKNAIIEQERADDYTNAIQSAKDLLALRMRVQGADHFDAITAKFEVSRLEVLSAQAVEKRREWRTAVLDEAEAQWLDSQGQYARAFPGMKRYSDLCRELLGENHPSTALSFNCVAMNLNAQGKAPEAVPYLQKALSIHRKVLGEDHPATAASYNDVARNLSTLGKAGEAEPLYQKALDIRRKVFGENHPITAQGYHNVAFNLNAQGRAADAAPFYEKALEITRKTLGDDHLETASRYNGFAANLVALGKPVDAAPLLQRALDIYRKVLGEDHPTTALSYNNLAFILNTQGKASEAEPHYRKALDISRNIHGEDHPATALSYHGLGMNLQNQGNLAEAGSLLQKSLDVRRKVFGDDHPDTALSYNSIAFNLAARGKADEAGRHYQKALDIRRKVLGEDHPVTAESYNNVAVNLSVQGKLPEAGPIYLNALAINRKILGEKHPSTARVLNNIAANLRARGHAADAQPMASRALEIWRNVFSEDHPDTATGYNNVGDNLSALGHAAEAAEFYMKALDIRRKVFGENHPETAQSYENLADNVKALAIRRKVLGEDHPQTAQSYNNVAAQLVARGDSQQAITVLSAAVHAFDSSRLANAQGIERASLTQFNPRFLLAALQRSRDPATAWMQLEFSLARGMLDQQGTNSISRLTPAEEQEQQSARIRLAAIQPRLLKLVTTTSRQPAESEELDKLLAERRALESTVARLAVADSERAVEPPDRIRASLPAGAALLYWVDVTSKSGELQEHWACVVRSQGDPRWERLPGTGHDKKWSKDDAALPGKLRTALAGSAAQAEVEALSTQLYAQRIAPILPHLDGVKTLYVISIKEMAGIPIEALTANYTISYVPSGTFLARRGKPLEKPATLLALGDPTFPADTKIPAPTALPPGGLLIKQVVPGGPAAKARLKPYDVLVSYAGTNIETVDQLRQAMADKASEKSVVIQIWREPENKLATFDLLTGNPGFVLAKEPARDAIAARRKADQLLASVTRGGEWGELPGSQVEVSEISTLFGSGNVTALTRSEASEPALNQLRKNGALSKFRYLHFATHGEANNVRAFDSKLILAQDHLQQLLAAPGEPWLNNELSSREVLDHWKLDAELVTLSACETAIGQDGGGDGMLGFAQAFLLSGSRSVCLSLWKVDDTATALLMDRFYRNLLGKRADGAKPMGKAAALAEAKTWLKSLKLVEATDRLGVITNGVSRGSKKGREVIGKIPAPSDSSPDTKPYSHPKYWAAFILIGDPD